MNNDPFIRKHTDYPQVVKDLVTIFPVLRDWLAEFLKLNCQMTASDVGHNLLIEQVSMMTARHLMYILHKIRVL